ncbi:hypothetical protein M407DRAFT_159428 [Tulasnella calospora MUT 4182]|uniref:Uncharacterized protein n=1 Tax=Tulasnella calospora MUT 4182 TaxID=1051891 RepID=A0A0C3QQS8_9AGAM|nr:hypothetical protein M407DRAFT_159428 [Tulasnella calospora MUT 4182]
MELGPNAEMSLAQEDESMAVVEVSQRLESLDMNPTAEDAYEQAVLSQARGNGSSSSVDSAVASLKTHVPAPTIVTTDHYREFLELLYSRFTQSVAPLPKVITKSFNTPPPRATLQEVDADGKVKEPNATSPPNTVARSSNSRVSYVPSSRSYSKPTPPANPARRRTTSAPSNPSSTATSLSLVRRQVTSTFDDLGSMMKVAEGMMDYMRTDMEEEMKRRRRRAREDNHQMDTSDDDEPLTRKVPVARSTAWYSATGSPLSQDPSVSSNLHIPPNGQRKLITPRRLRTRLSGPVSPLTTIPESTEPGQALSSDAIEKCTSSLTTLKLDDASKSVQPMIPKPTAQISTPPVLASNPIRLYVGYNRDCTVRSSFVFGTDMVSTPSAYNPTSYEIVL